MPTVPLHPIRSLLPLAAALLLGGCPTAPTQPDPPSARELDALSRPQASPAPRPTPTLPERKPLSLLDDPASPLYRKIIYFDYDAAEIQPRWADLLRAHAGYLYQTPGAAVTLEGHTDERGTRDYNLALGERRADAVRRFLVAEGVPSQKLTTLSFGEERPADAGHSESARAKNRRVVLDYAGN